MRKFLSDGVTIILVICAVALTSMAGRSQFQKSRNLLNERRVSNWQVLATEGHRRGSSHAQVPVIEFADFQCPSCALARFSLDTVLAKHPSDVALIFRHYPLRMTHPHALAAANAAECGGEQGRFFEFAEHLFSDQAAIGTRPWAEFAVAAGIPDTARFAACIRAQRYSTHVERDAAVGDSLDLIGTPTIIVNGKLLVGAIRTGVLEREVQQALVADR